jgi:hypothetical protein
MEPFPEILSQPNVQRIITDPASFISPTLGVVVS